MWGYVKSTFHKSPVTRSDDLEKHITDVIMALRANILLRTQISHLEYFRTW